MADDERDGPWDGVALHVRGERCSTCVFHPGNKMQLAEGRLAEIIRLNRESGSALRCHQTLEYSQEREPAAVCRGYFDAYGDDSTLRLARRLGVVVFDARKEGTR